MEVLRVAIGIGMLRRADFLGLRAWLARAALKIWLESHRYIRE
jgi:hypothetical protein